MSSANDNAMTRFLFAILRQKCLKDIDWNKVAHDPILAQEITNGHAARMRYSRFRSAMLGLEPQKRKRAEPNKSKVTKSKKDKDAKGRKDETVKPEPSEETSAAASSLPTASPSPKIKQETIPPIPDADSQAAFSPQEAALFAETPSLPDTQSQLHARLLTPCSDTDAYAASSGYAASPASELLQSQQPAFDFIGDTHCEHEASSWHQSQTYATFAVPYAFDGYVSTPCEHQQLDQDPHHHVDELFASAILMGSASLLPEKGNPVVIKHEDWEGHYQQ